MTKAYTENLAYFGIREIEMLRDMLTAWLEHGLPDELYDYSMRPAFNRTSGDVFLVNDNYQVVMMNGDRLEVFHSLPYDGIEGFLSDLLNDYSPDDLHEDDVQYLLDSARAAGLNITRSWMAAEMKLING